MERNKKFDFNVDAQSSRSVSTSMDQEFDGESAHESSSTEPASSRKNNSARIRQKRKEYSPEVSHTPQFKRSTVSKDLNNSKEKIETESLNTPRSVSKSRSKHAVKRFSPANDTTSVNKEAPGIVAEPSREVIFLSHLGAILREKFSYVEDFALDYKKLGIKVTEPNPSTSPSLNINISSSEKASTSSPTLQQPPSKKSSTGTQKKTAAVKLKLPRKKSVDKVVKLEEESPVSSASIASEDQTADTSIVMQSESSEAGNTPQSSSRPKRLAAGKGRDFISQLVGPSRRQSKVSEQSDSEKTSQKPAVTADDRTSVTSDKTDSTEDTATIIREAGIIASALSDLTTKPRRSLQSMMSPKLRSITALKGEGKGDSKSDFKISARPNSALDIVRNAKLYQRVRSPSPDLKSSSSLKIIQGTSEPSVSETIQESVKESTDPVIEPDESDESKTKEIKLEEMDSDTQNAAAGLLMIAASESSQPEEKTADVDPKELNKESEKVAEKPLVENEIVMEAEKEKEQEEEKEEKEKEALKVEEKAVVNNDKDKKESASVTPQVKPGRSKGKLLNENGSPVKPIPVVLNTPALKAKADAPVRSSRRIVKPVRFQDFVTDRPVGKVEQLASSSAASASSSEETPAEPTPTAKVNRSKTKTSGSGNKRKSESIQPIRLKLRLDGKRSSIISGAGVPTKAATPESTNVPEAATATVSESVAVPDVLIPEPKTEDIDDLEREITPFLEEDIFGMDSTPTDDLKRELKLKKKSSKSWVYGYTPSVKPVLEDHVHADGTVEKIGVVVYAVMDRILLEVCQDGVSRHSGAISKKDRRQRAMGIAKQRYLEKKAEYEVLKAACLAKGETPPVFSHTLTSHKRQPKSMATDSDTLSGGRAERTKKGGLYKQNEYLMKTSKGIRKPSESEESESKETKTRKALEYLAMQFQREMDSDLQEEKNAHDKRKRRHDGYTMVRNENDYYAHDRAADTKEKQREKVIPFSSFLENKPAGLSQSLCVSMPSDSSQPQDFFYRDLLYRTIPEQMDTSYATDNIDITTEDPRDINETAVVINADAQLLANHIGTILVRPCQPDGSYSVSDFYDIIRQENELRQAIVNQAMDIITDQYVSEEVTLGKNANVTIYNSTLRNATLLRDVFNMFSEEQQTCVFWAHKVFVEALPTHFLASYLILLRYCKTLTNSYIGKIIKNCANDSYPWPDVVEMLTEFTNTKVVDPDLDMLNRTVTSCLLSDVVFLLVSPAISAGDFVLKARYHENVFRWLKQMGHPDSEIMRMSFNEEYESCSVAQICDTMIDKIVQKIKQFTKTHRDKRIVLVGWQTTCFFNHRAVQLTHGVSAIIDLAFPVLTTEGPRGTADDDILLTYCPSLFIVGSEAEDFDPVAMKELRSHMIVPTGLVVVAHTDANLMASNTVLNKMCITQKTVHRALVEQVHHFLILDETKRERSQLIPVELNNVYNVDPTKFSARDKQKIAAEKEEVGRAKKKRYAGPFSPPPPAMQTLSSDMTLSTSQARNRFDQMLKKSLPPFYEPRKAKDEVARKESFREPRVPSATGYKSSPLPSPSIRPNSAEGASNLLDPALISLS